MKVSIANVFVKNGDMEYNYNLFKKFYDKSLEQKDDLIIFPRMFLCGPKNDFSDKDFIYKNIDFLKDIVDLTQGKNTAILIGGIYYLDPYVKDGINYDGVTNDSTFFIKDGYLENTISRKEYSKVNHFNDYRHFDKELYLKNFQLEKNKFSVFISDDIYHDENIFLIKSQNTDFLICLDSTLNENSTIENRLIKISKFYRKPIIYLNNATFVDDGFLNGDIFVIDENQNVLISDNYKIDCLYTVHLDYEDGSEVYIKDKIDNVTNNKHNLLNKLSEIENKKVLFINGNICENYNLINNYEQKEVNFSDYCKIYNELDFKDKRLVEKIILNHLFFEDYIVYYDQK